MYSCEQPSAARGATSEPRSGSDARSAVGSRPRRSPRTLPHVARSRPHPHCAAGPVRHTPRTVAFSAGDSSWRPWLGTSPGPCPRPTCDLPRRRQWTDRTAYTKKVLGPAPARIGSGAATGGAQCAAIGPRAYLELQAVPIVHVPGPLPPDPAAHEFGQPVDPVQDRLEFHASHSSEPGRRRLALLPPLLRSATQRRAQCLLGSTADAAPFRSCPRLHVTRGTVAQPLRACWLGALSLLPM